MSSTENRDSFPPAWSGDDAEPRPLAADSVARKLRETRTASHQDLDDIANALRIRYDYLLAIEEGRFEDLPGPTYAVGFVRAYADYLKLDPEDIASRFKVEVADVTRRTELVFPSPEPETRIPGSLIFLASAVLIAGAYGVWYFASAGSDQMAEPPRVDEVPEVPAAEAPAPQPSVSVAELPQAPADFVDPTDTDPASGGPQANDPGDSPAEVASGAQVAAAESGATDAIEPPAPVAETEVAAASEAADTSPAEIAAADDQSSSAVPAEAEALEPSEVVEDNDATVEATPPTSGPEIEESAVEPAAAAEAEAPVEAAVAEPTPAEAPAEEAATEPAAQTTVAEPPTDEAVAAAQNEVPERTDGDQGAEAIVVARGTETAETQTEAQPEPQADPATPPTAVPRQREGVTITPLPPQAPTRQPAAQPEPVQTAALGEAEPEAPAVYGEVNGGSRIVVRAIHDSYVLIRDAEDKLILTKVLRRGETYQVPDQQGLTMLTGNAGGLQIEVDGQAAPSVGALGAIVRNIELDPTRLKSGTATNP